MDKSAQKDGSLKARANKILDMFKSFGVEMAVASAVDGRTALHIELVAKSPIRMKALKEYEDDICYALGVAHATIEAPIKGKKRIGIRIPHEQVPFMTWSDIAQAESKRKKIESLSVIIGKDEFNKDVVADFATVSHLLVSGETGSGKSCLLHTMICSLISRFGPERVRFILDDAKRVEFDYHYRGLPHLLTPTISDPKKSLLALKWLNKEMERRFNVLEEGGYRSISDYHARRNKDKGDEDMPYIMMIFDEFSDLMMRYPRETEASIVPLTQMSRAVGIHLVITTSRPGAKVLPSMIRANIPSCVTFMLSSAADSRAVLDTNEAVHLRGVGDAFFIAAQTDYAPLRLQTASISDDEIQNVVTDIKKKHEDELSDSELVPAEKYWKAPSGSIFSNMGDQSENDDLYNDAVDAVREAGQASTSYLQRKLGVGYSRAARLMDLLEEGGVITPGNGAAPRKVIQRDDEK